MNILVILTCFNRKEKTKNCIETLVKGNMKCTFTFLVVDDNSTDGTINMLEDLKYNYDIYIVKGTGDLFYSGGMRRGMEYALKENFQYDYLLMVNDDVEFFEHCIESMIIKSNKKGNSVIVGPTCDKDGEFSYGAIKYLNSRRLKYRNVSIDETEMKCDSFNANCVILPYEIFEKIGAIDRHYIHSLGDFDYGLMVSKSGYDIYSLDIYVGICNKNPKKNTWGDKSLSIFERIKIKETRREDPIGPWFYFLKKNFGLVKAIFYSITPYIRIILKK